MLKSETILVALIFACLMGYGQQEIILQGVVKDTSGIILSKASIILSTRGDTLKEISRKDGTYSFSVQQAGKFDLQVTMKGYTPYRNTLTVSQAEHSITLAPIILKPEYEQLAPVEVIKVKPMIKKEDTVTYNTAAYAVRAGSELERLLRKLPGISWDMDGNLTFEGKTISRIMVNGQDFTLGTLKTALQNLPADIIDKVQVIDDYGDKAALTGVKSGRPTEVLNIILKNDKRNGNTSKIEVGAGNKGKYTGSLFSDFFSGDRQFTINGKLLNTSPSGDLNERLLELGYTDKWNSKWSPNIRLAIWGDNHSSASSNIQSNYFSNDQINMAQKSSLLGNNQNELINYLQTWLPNINTKIRVSAMLGLYHTSETTVDNYSDNELDSGFAKMTSGQSQVFSHGNSSLLGSDLYFEKKNPYNRQKMTIEGSFRLTGNNPTIDTYNQATVTTDSLQSLSNYHYRTDIANTHREITSKLTYYFPIGKQGLLELGYAWNYSNMHDNHFLFASDSISDALLPIDSLSQIYTFTTASNTFHAGFLTHSRKLNLTLSLGAQPGTQVGHTAGKILDQSLHYFFPLPLIQFSYNLSKNQKFILQYNGVNTAPAPQQLEPATDLTNPQVSTQGNPMLKPLYTHLGSLQYELTSLKPDNYWGLSVSLTYKNIRDMIIPGLIYAHDTSGIIQQTTYINANGFHSLTLAYRLTLPELLHKRFQINAFGSILEQQTPTQSDGSFYEAHSQTWSQSLQLRWDIPDNIETNLAASYSTTISHYSAGTSRSYIYPAFNWSFHYRQEFLKKWAVENLLSQAFAVSSSNRLRPTPALLNASIQRDLFPRNKARISFSVFDLFNGSNGVTQIVSPTGITQTWTNLIGRYFLLTIAFKLEQFRSPLNSGLK